jgi:hypothetical protein
MVPIADLNWRTLMLWYTARIGPNREMTKVRTGMTWLSALFAETAGTGAMKTGICGWDTPGTADKRAQCAKVRPPTPSSVLASHPEVGAPLKRHVGE